MKKIITAILSVLCAVLFTIGLAACTNGSSADYEVTVKSRGGAALSDVVVTLYDGNKSVAEKRTDKNGFTAFDVKAGTYTVILDDLPAGYDQPSSNLKLTSDTKKLEIVLDSHVIEREMPKGKRYKIGDVMYDFTVTTDSGSTFQLSEALKTKKFVLINLWATWCGNCLMEFPYLAQSYAKYNGENQAALIAISNYDTLDQICTWKTNNTHVTFDMAFDSPDLFTAFQANAIPMSIYVDRYGVCADIHTGAFDNVGAFDAVFEKYLADDYGQDFKDPSTGGEEADWAICPDNIKMPASSVLEAAANGANFTGTYRGVTEKETENYKYYWPWLAGNDEKGSYLYSSNLKSTDPTYSGLYLDFHMEKDQMLTLELDASIAANSAMFGIIFDGRSAFEVDGPYVATGKTLYLYVAREAGDYSMMFTYVSTIANSDSVKIRNIRLVDKSAIESTGESLDNRYHCSTQPTFNDKNEQTGWAHYEQVGLGADGYYHLLDNNGDPKGAFVLAELVTNTTHFTNEAVATYLTSSSSASLTGMTEAEIAKLNRYASISQISDITNFTPVTEELKILLQKFCFNLTGAPTQNNPNEWLELCSYFVHYGAGEDIFGSVDPENHDPIEGCAPFCAVELKETTGIPEANYKTDYNRVEIKRLYHPRGIYAAFVAPETGLYRFRSYGTNDVGEEYDTFCYITDANEETISTKADDLMQTVVDDNDKRSTHFTIYLNLEKGKTYYVRCDIEGGEFGTIYLGIEHITAASEGVEDGVVKVLRRMSLGNAYTFDLDIYEATNEQVMFYVPVVIAENYGQDAYGNWVANTGVNGFIQSKIYLDLATTYAFPSIRNIVLGLNDEGNPTTYKYFTYDRKGEPIYKLDSAGNIVTEKDANGNDVPVYEKTFNLDFNFSGTDRNDGIDYSPELAKLRELGVNDTSFNAYMRNLVETAEETGNYLVEMTEELALILNMFMHRITPYRTPEIELVNAQGVSQGLWTEEIFIDRLSTPNKPYYEWVAYCVYYDYYTV